MSYINENFLELQDSYLFSTIAKKVAKYTTKSVLENNEPLEKISISYLATISKIIVKIKLITIKQIP